MNQLNKLEVAAMQADIKSVKRSKSSVWTMWDGIVFYGKTAAEFAMGLSAAGTLVMAGRFAYTHHEQYPVVVVWAMYAAVILMALTAAKVLGKFLKEKGKQ